jgi:hypothetical protein
MNTTSRIGLATIDDHDTAFSYMDWIFQMAYDGAESNMGIIDEEIGKLQDRVIFSATQPTGQRAGDVWNQQL